MRRLAALSMLVLTIGCAPVERTAPAAKAGPPMREPETNREIFAAAHRSFAAADFDAAARGFETLVDRYPELQDYCLHYLASSRARLGEEDAALLLWLRLETAQPQSRFALDAKLERGRLLHRRGDLSASRAELIGVLDAGREEQKLAALAELAAIDEEEGDIALAYERFMRVRRDASGTALDQRAKEAVARLRRVDPALAPTGEALESELRLLIAERDFAAALDLADRLLAAVDGQHKATVLRLRADAERALGRFDAALESLRNVFRLYPESPDAPEALYRYSSWLWNRDRDTEAKEGFLEYRRRYPSSRRAEVLYALGRIEETAQRDADAISLYAELARLEPRAKEAGEALWRIGWIRYRRGEWNAAARAFESARAGDDSESALYWRARSLQRSGATAEAARIYEQIASEAPASYYAHWAEARLGRESPLGGAWPETDPAHEIGSPPAGSDVYHLVRARELRAIDLRPLARRELQAYERANGGDRRLVDFLLAAYPAVDGYRDAIRLAFTRPYRDPRVLYPLAFWPLVRARAESLDLDPLLVLSLMRQESLFDPSARSPADARGLMQLLPTTARRVGDRLGQNLRVADLYMPETNIALGVAYLEQLLREQNGDWMKALAAYNGGEGALAKWEARFGGLPPDEFVESITYRETRDYVKKVLTHYRHYRQTYTVPRREPSSGAVP